MGRRQRGWIKHVLLFNERAVVLWIFPNMEPEAGRGIFGDSLGLIHVTLTSLNLVGTIWPFCVKIRHENSLFFDRMLVCLDLFVAKLALIHCWVALIIGHTQMLGESQLPPETSVFLSKCDETRCGPACFDISPTFSNGLEKLLTGPW